MLTRILWLVSAWAVLAHALGATDFSVPARDWERQLRQQILPYWFDTAQDTNRGGYLLADDARKGRGRAVDKQLVSQSRMVWGFAHAHRKGLGGDSRDYRAASAQGWRFLRDHFRDPQRGGYWWKTDLAGTPINDGKFLYGLSFVVYALVEYHRASGDPEPLNEAMALYQAIQRHLHDPIHGGWNEHADADWKPLKPGDPRNEVEVVGLKSANAHLHWMEALAELYDVSRDPQVRQSLEEALRINREYFYPARPGESCFHRQPDWKPVTDARSAGLSYGHNVEFAWLMLRAQDVLGQPRDWTHFEAHIDHALRHGFDRERGGLYSRGADDQPATDTAKVWWAQAEMVAALAYAVRHQSHPAHAAALEQLLQFIGRYQVDPRDGIWLDTVSADGAPVNTAKAHNWKANYHDVRAMVIFVEAFRDATPAPRGP